MTDWFSLTPFDKGASVTQDGKTLTVDYGIDRKDPLSHLRFGIVCYLCEVIEFGNHALHVDDNV